MHSLYWRIFLAFWVALALILVGTLTVAVNATAHRTDRPWVLRGQLYAQAARAFESGGPAALKDWLEALSGEPFSRTFVVDPAGTEMMGRPLPQGLAAALPGQAMSPGVIAAKASAPRSRPRSAPGRRNTARPAAPWAGATAGRTR